MPDDDTNKDLWMIASQPTSTSFAIAGSKEGAIVFKVGEKLEALRFEPNGQIYVQGRLATTDIEVIQGLKDWLSTAQPSGRIRPESPCGMCLRRISYDDGMVKPTWSSTWMHEMCATRAEEYRQLLEIVGAALVLKQETSLLQAHKDKVPSVVLQIMLDHLPENLQKAALETQLEKHNG